MSGKRAAPDHYALMAKKEGYPARSVYKLKEIQQKFALLPSRGKVLDIGAAPGSWTLFVSKLLKTRGTVTAVDLKPLNMGGKPDNVVFFQGDAFCEEFGRIASKEGPYNTVISDAAPSTTGNRTVDTARSQTLADKVIELADKVLLPGGNLVIKVFQGGDEQELLKKINHNYKNARLFKPKSSRKESFEIFMVGMGKL